ncbi:MFS general substrate transporter [Artomyces pyxidatus]|uniref:MFS general substrate transporter n=1 Tax=Artomyces pyxidatus TaxID=48021 RepID=A0ACB8T2Z1_9AGAM|nr:MFS general substrate transporter [Artomyces pyxidatus]
MAVIFRDTFFDYLLRACGVRISLHPEERDPSLWPVVDQEKYPGGGAKRDGADTPHSDSSLSAEKNAANVETQAPPGRVVIDWYGPDDSANPHNWSRAKKIWVMAQTCLWTFTMYIGSSIYTSGIPDIAEKFGVSQVAATVGLTLFVVGYGLGPMIWAPMSEIPQIGRMPIYIVTCILFTALQVPTALATNYGMLMAFRFLGAFVGSPILATGGATCADMYDATWRAYAITIWGWFAIAAPTLGPVVGGFAAHAKGWRWTIWELLWLCGFTVVILFFFYPETSHTNILYRRAQRLRRLTQNPEIKSQTEVAENNFTVKDIVMMMLVRAIALNFQEPIVLALNLYIALIYALLYCWFESLPIVFIEIYGFRPQLVGLTFLGVLMGGVISIPFFFYYMRHFLERKTSANGSLRPEERMLGASIGALFIPICLFWFGWSSRPSIHWIMPIIGSSFFSFGGVFLFNSVLNYLADAYPMYAASVLAGNDLMRSGAGAAFPLFAGALYHNLGVGWASTLLGLLACAFVPIPILLYLYGEKIRRLSKRARHDI